MKKFATVGLALLVLFVLGAASAGSASAAEPKTIFLESKTKSTFTATSEKGHLSTHGVPISIECKKSKSSGTAEKSGGTLTIDFEGCTLLGEECHSLGDSSGTILTGGSYTDVYDSLSTEKAGLLPALLFEPKELHIECKIASELLLVKGTILLLFGELTSGKEVETTTIITTVKEGKPGDTNYWLKSEETVKHPLLLTSVSGGTFEESGDESENNKVTYGAKEMAGAEF
jgi:hypothetical protein